jgi:hypothetical protein
MNRTDGDAMRHIDRIIFNAQALKQQYLQAVEVANHVPLPSGWSTERVATSGVSDPTAAIALSARRQIAQKRLAHVRKEVRAAALGLESAAITTGLIIEQSE